MNPELTQAIIRTTLREMFHPDSYFDICKIDTIMQLTGRVVPKPTYDTLRLLHCMHWRKMEPTMPQLVLEQVLALFDLEAVDLTPLDAAAKVVTTEPVRRKGLLGLLGH